MSEAIILTPLVHALASLERAAQQPSNEFMRDAVIQRFKYTYELCWKILRRRLIVDEGTAVVTPLSRKALFRLGAQKQWLDDPIIWLTCHQARNETSHTYDEEKAEAVYTVALQFIPAVYSLLPRLQRAGKTDTD